MANLRFFRAIDDVRPYGTHRYDVYGPKVDRRLTLFGHRRMPGCSSSSIPMSSPTANARFAFPISGPHGWSISWVHGRDDGERFLVVLRGSELQSFAAQRWQFEAFEAWARKTGILVCLIGAEEGAPVGVLQRNQATILHHVAADHTFVTEEMKQRVLAACGEGAMVGELESRVAPVDGTLVRSAAFMLVLDGRLRCPTLAREPLSGQTQLVFS